ncbi:MAG: hypothetical protein K2O01_01275 [Bacteroidales bacterium]|nr:hypothetical protein [Bacteroidales bacterium]
MKKHVLLHGLLWLAALGGLSVATGQPKPTATAGDLPDYKRSSLYTVLATHLSQRYGAQIDSVFIQLPIPDKYEDHNLPDRYIACPKRENRLRPESMATFIDTSEAAKKMVAKWFDRNPETGTFDLGLIAERGHYNASEADVREALLTQRGLALIADAGENLIENTFLIINDIVYVDKEKGAAIASAVFSGLALVAAATSVAGAASGNTDAAEAGVAATELALVGSAISNSIAGFTVKVTSYLYRLRWNDSIAAVFYNDFWCDTNYAPEEIARRKALFDGLDGQSGLFALDYIGKYRVKSDKTVLRGLHDNNDVIRKVCARALDKNIAALQKKYEVFKVKTPVTAVNGLLLQSPVGLKEGLKPGSKFEVLEQRMDDDGNISYQRMAVVKPIKHLIWDNRFMAAEEEAAGADFGATTFKKKGGGHIAAGMLLRQLK